MNLIIMLIVGGILGWFASIIMRTDGQQGMLLNVVVGVVGAVPAGYLLTPFLGGSPITSGAFDIKSVPLVLMGSIEPDNWFRMRRHLPPCWAQHPGHPKPSSALGGNINQGQTI
jgi:uncharacterized membrane protein YeaQ/YmgE (transglycosylase-associated protein family)